MRPHDQHEDERGPDAGPRQGPMRGAVVVVTTREGAEVRGVVVRDDVEHPFETLIRLADGRFFRPDEIESYRPIDEEA